MSGKKMHPSVLKFKEFVKNNPKLIQEVRKGNATWQELYEDWYLLGEDDERWDSIGINKKEETEMTDQSKQDWMSTITGLVKKMDANQLQYHINNLSQAIGAVQGLLGQFQQNNSGGGGTQMREMDGPKHPFTFRKD